MRCNSCNGTGFTNVHQIPEGAVANVSVDEIQRWIDDQTEPHDVCVCDCCGNGEEWYGEPGGHYGPDDPMGKDGPYAYNGGLCECH